MLAPRSGSSVHLMAGDGRLSRNQEKLTLARFDVSKVHFSRSLASQFLVWVCMMFKIIPGVALVLHCSAGHPVFLVEAGAGLLEF